MWRRLRHRIDSGDDLRGLVVPLDHTEVPISVLTGFLGSGKTTLLNVVLHGEHHYRMGVIVNEFGQVDVDSQLIRAAREDIVEMPNGCLCCSAQGNLMAALGRLLDRSKPAEYLLVEASGLAEPVALAQALLHPELDPRLRLDGVISVADAKFVETTLSERPEAPEQLAFADVVVLNKIDLASATELAAAETAIQDLNPSARILKTSYGRVPPGDLINLRAFSAGQRERLLNLPSRLASHHSDLVAVSVRAQHPLGLGLLNKWLARTITQLGRHLLRAKGLLSIAGSPERWVLQVVRDMVGVSPDGLWPPDEPPQSVIVFIGRQLDGAALQRGFTACAVAG